jgi:tetratricopeptide (TPR) repeat protein
MRSSGPPPTTRSRTTRSGWLPDRRTQANRASGRTPPRNAAPSPPQRVSPNRHSVKGNARMDRTSRPRQCFSLGRCWLLAGALLLGATFAPLLPSAAADGLADARELARGGNYRDAIAMATTLVTAEPDNVAAARFLQDLVRRHAPKQDAAAAIPAGSSDLVRRGLTARLLPPKQAATALEGLVAKEGASPLFQLDLARAQMALEKIPLAEGIVARYLKIAEGDVEALTLQGRLLEARGRYSTARSAYERALERSPGYPPAAVRLATGLGEAGKDEDARGVLQNALALYPRSPPLVLALADDQIRRGENEAAVKTLQSLFALEADELATQERLGIAYRALRMWKEAESSATRALALDKNSVAGLRTLAFVKQKRGDYPGALEGYQQVIRLRPTWPQAYVDAGFVQVLSEDRIGARKSLEKALKLDKDHLEANLRMGIYYYLGDDPKRAKKHLEFVLKKEGENVPANRYLGYVLVREGKPKNALKHFKKVSELREKDVDSVRMMGKALMGMGKLEEAVDMFRNAIARDDKNALAYFDLAKGLQAQEKWEDAEAALRKSIALDAKASYPNLYLAEIMDEVNDDAEGALPFYKRYLELEGEDTGDVVQKRIDQIERDLEEEKDKKKK